MINSNTRWELKLSELTPGAQQLSLSRERLNPMVVGIYDVHVFEAITSSPCANAAGAQSDPSRAMLSKTVVRTNRRLIASPYFSTVSFLAASNPPS